MGDAQLEVGQVAVGMRCLYCVCGHVRVGVWAQVSCPGSTVHGGLSGGASSRSSGLSLLPASCWQRVVVMGKRKGVVRFFGPTAYGPGAVPFPARQTFAALLRYLFLPAWFKLPAWNAMLLA